MRTAEPGPAGDDAVSISGNGDVVTRGMAASLPGEWLRRSRGMARRYPGAWLGPLLNNIYHSE